MNTVCITRSHVVLIQDISIPALYFTVEKIFATPWFSHQELEETDVHFRLLLQAEGKGPDDDSRHHRAVLQVCDGLQREAAIAREKREGGYSRFGSVDPEAEDQGTAAGRRRMMVFSKACLTIQGAGEEYLPHGARLVTPSEHTWHPFQLQLNRDEDDAQVDPKRRLLVTFEAVVVLRTLSPMVAGTGGEEAVVHPAALSMNTRAPVRVAYTFLELEQEFSVPTVHLINVELYATPWFSRPEFEKRDTHFRLILLAHGIHDFLYEARLQVCSREQRDASTPSEKLDVTNLFVGYPQLKDTAAGEMLILRGGLTVAGAGSRQLDRGTRLVSPCQRSFGAIQIVNPPVDKDPKSCALISFRAEVVVSGPCLPRGGGGGGEELERRPQRRCNASRRKWRSATLDADTELDLALLSCQNWRGSS